MIATGCLFNSFAECLTFNGLCFRSVSHHLGQCTSIWRNRIDFREHRLPGFLGDYFNSEGIHNSGTHCVSVARLMDPLVAPVCLDFRTSKTVRAVKHAFAN